jgi:hypothetical protein
MLDVRAPIFVATAVLVCCALSIFTKTDLTFALLAGTSAGVFVGAFVDNITAAKTEMRVKDSTEEIDVELDAERSHYQDLRQFMQINLNILPSEAKHALQNLAQTPDSFKNTKTKKIKKRKIATVASNAA